MGLSSHPDGGYDKKTQAADLRGVLQQLDIEHSAVVGHDIGTMVAYAYAARYSDKTDRLVVMDAPVPGIPPWDEIVRNPRIWQLSFGGHDPVSFGWLPVASAFISTASGTSYGDRTKVDEATRVHYAELYARPGAMHSAFAQFLSIPQDALDNKKTMATKLAMPVLAIGGAKSFGNAGRRS